MDMTAARQTHTVSTLTKKRVQSALGSLGVLSGFTHFSLALINCFESVQFLVFNVIIIQVWVCQVWTFRYYSINMVIGV